MMMVTKSLNVVNKKIVGIRDKDGEFIIELEDGGEITMKLEGDVCNDGVLCQWPVVRLNGDELWKGI